MTTLIGKVVYNTEDGYYLDDGVDFHNLVFVSEEQAEKVPLQTKVAIAVHKTTSLVDKYCKYVVCIEDPFFQELE